MEITIIITVATIYGGIFALILLCLFYSLYNLKKIRQLDEEKKKNIDQILKNSEDKK